VSDAEQVEVEVEVEAQIEDAAQAPAAPEEIELRPLETVIAELRASGRTPEQMLEALLFSTHTPLSKDEISQALRMDFAAVDASLARLEQALETRGAPVRVFERSKDDGSLKKLAGQVGYILDVKMAYRQTMVTAGRPVLSQSLTETLALIALNQPIGQSRLVRERGSTVYEHVKDLLRRGWIMRAKKGRSYELRTTETFAAEFGLQDDPALIKRALARTAGVHGEAELVGSNRIHFDSGAEGSQDLVAEARNVEPELTLPRFEDLMALPETPEDEAPDGEASFVPTPVLREDTAPVDPELIALLEQAAEAPVGDCLVSGGAAFSEAPTERVTRLHPDDCVISGGDIPQTQETTMASQDTPTPEQDGEDLSKSESVKRSRLTNLFDLLDDDSTDDDW
jgi:segregation and condensation protein B